MSEHRYSRRKFLRRAAAGSTGAALASLSRTLPAGASDASPLPPEDPLWTTGNVLITSHSSGASEGSNRRCTELFLENVRRYMIGLPLLNVVHKRRGY
jgi:hypothetical protein